jgi:ABC-type bacteriocin/lantibiotic exporter with double-glycine peptidase domain
MLPYEPQSPGDGQCGASCVVMMLRAYGKLGDRAKVWKKIRQPRNGGGFYTTSRRITEFLLGRNLSSLAVRARDPFKMLKGCKDQGVNGIVSVRLDDSSGLGHYVALVDCEADGVLVHDPAGTPNRRISRQELARLQTPTDKHEITARVLILVSNNNHSDKSCSVCSKPIPQFINCQRCGSSISLSFSNLLGCVDAACSNRQWDHIICSTCDADNG